MRELPNRELAKRAKREQRDSKERAKREQREIYNLGTHRRKGVKIWSKEQSALCYF